MDERHRILLACFPKSGSTWLRMILAELPGFKTAWITDSTGRGEQELSAWRVARASFGHFVAQHHVRYHDDTRRLIDQFGLTPVVLVRDIADSVVSLLDHVRHRWPEIPQAFVTPELRALPEDQILDFLIDMAVPWYIDFYVSWTNSSDAIRVRYEDLHADPQATVATLLQRLQIEVDDGIMHDAVAAAALQDSLRNRAVIGRGKRLTADQRDRILKQASYYPSVDFTPIGLAMPAQRTNTGEGGEQG